MKDLNIPFLSEPHVAAVVEALGILLIGWIVTKIIIKIARRSLRKSPIDEASHALILRVIWIVAMLLVGLTALSRLNVNMGPIMAALGTCGVAIALALKDSLGNVAGGILLVLTKPFTAGDEVEINGVVGIVDRIDLFTTHLHTLDNRVIILPNGNITTSMVINATQRDIRRVGTYIYVGYDSDIEKARKAIIQVVEESDGLLLSQPAPMIELDAHGERALVYNVGAWCRTEDRYDARSYLEEQIKLKFDEEGITIPYPQMEVHIRNREENSQL